MSHAECHSYVGGATCVMVNVKFTFVGLLESPVMRLGATCILRDFTVTFVGLHAS